MTAAADPAVDLLDVVLVVAILVAVIGGYRLGFFARALSWVGLVVGVGLAVHFLPALIRAAHLSSSGSRLLVAAVVLVGGGFVGQALGMLVGGRLHAVLPLGPLRSADRVVGGLAGGVGVLVALWLLLPSIASVAGWPAQATRGSAISRWVGNQLPAPPDALRSLRNLVGTAGFPTVFDSLAPGQAVGLPPSQSPLGAVTTRRVAGSTVEVQGPACDRIQEGSGFAVGADLVVTNAHVVAGEPGGTTVVLTPTGRRLPAVVVAYDPNRDLALLRVGALGATALPIGPAATGRHAVVFGHPGGQTALAVQPARVAETITAVGRDLYDRHRTSRRVLVLAARLQPGDSGGALVDRRGRVIGVAFAVALDRSDTAYALATSELRAFVAAAPPGASSTAAAVSTQGCVG